jgi:hypothetical protein
MLESPTSSSAACLIYSPPVCQWLVSVVPNAHRKSPLFVKINFVITSVWAPAFACIVAADLMMIYMPTDPIRVGIVVTIAALYGA